MRAATSLRKISGRHKGAALSLLCILFFIVACIHTSTRKPKDGVQISLDYNKFILKAEVNTEGYRGPVAARAYGYIGIAAYEAGLPGFNGDFVSMTMLYPMIKIPIQPLSRDFNLPVALNACYHTILSYFFMSAPDNIRKQQKDIYTSWEDRLSDNLDEHTYRISKDFGIAVAKAIYAWSTTDSIGDKANHHNYDRNYTPPLGDGMWTTSLDFPMPALLPLWGRVRPFLINTDDFLAKPLPAYTTEANSYYYNQAMEVFTLSKKMSAENQWIASFWNDDRPGLTFTPAGHWLAITNQVIEREEPSIEKTLETYLKVGISLSDAMIACWNSKYHYNMERPESYIKRNIANDWRPVSPTPSFPSYPSGHSTMGAAAAVVLTAMYGAHYSMVDNSHKDLTEFEINPRSFRSFEAMSKENALSRMLLGVHFRMDCEEGLRLGELIGAQVAGVQLEKKLNQ